MYYDIEVVRHAPTQPLRLETFNAIAYLVHGEERLPVKVMAGTFEREIAEQYAERLREIYDLDGSRLGSIEVIKIMRCFQVIGKRRDGSWLTMNETVYPGELEVWLKNNGLVLVTPDARLSDKKFKQYNPFAGIYKRDIEKHYQAYKAREAELRGN